MGARSNSMQKVDSGGSMELVLDAISDIQSTIMNLQQTMDMKTPQIIKKYVSQHHAPRYSGIEDKAFIDSETARIMKLREEEEKLQLEQIRKLRRILAVILMIKSMEIDR